MAETKQIAWRDLYREAVMESDPERLRIRIAVAYKAIRTRMAEVRQDKAAQFDEQARLDCAMHFLHLLKGISERKSNRPRGNMAAA